MHSMGICLMFFSSDAIVVLGLGRKGTEAQCCAHLIMSI